MAKVKVRKSSFKTKQPFIKGLGYKHTYLNPNLIPELRVNKEGIPVVKLINPKKREKKTKFDENIIDSLDRETRYYLEKWSMDEYYGKVKQQYLYENGIAKQEIEKNLSYVDEDDLKTVQKVKETLDKIFETYDGSGIRTIYRGFNIYDSNFFKEYYPEMYQYYKKQIDILKNAKEGDIIELDFKEPTSWTTDELVALSFSTKNDNDFELVLSEDMTNYELESIRERNDLPLDNIFRYVIEIEGSFAEKNGYEFTELSLYPDEKEVVLKPSKGKFKVALKRIYEYSIYDVEDDRYHILFGVKIKLVSV